MTFVRLVGLPVAALLSGGSTPGTVRHPFDGTWMTCETWRGVRICSYKVLVQRGARVCGLQSYFATDRTYIQRFVATVTGPRARVDRICGDPGSETTMYCAPLFSSAEVRSGWGTSNMNLYVCGKRLRTFPMSKPFTCGGTRALDDLTKVRSLDGEGPEPEDAAWLKACSNGAEW